MKDSSCNRCNDSYNTCEQVYVHDVNHYYNVHTNYVNRHIMKHKYIPVYTCSTCDVYEDVYEPCMKTSNF